MDQFNVSKWEVIEEVSKLFQSYSRFPNFTQSNILWNQGDNNQYYCKQ